MSLPAVVYVRHGRRTVTTVSWFTGYKVTLTRQPDGNYSGRWTYPQRSGEVRTSSGWSEDSIMKNVRNGDWAWDLPDTVRTQDGL